jgi:MFS family permease
MPAPSSLSNVTRRTALAVLAMAIGQTAVYIVRPTTSYRLLALGHGATAVGIVAATFALVPLFLAIPLGRRADRGRGARLLLYGCGIETLGCALLALVRSPVLLGTGNAIVGIGHLALALGSQSVVARESDDEHHDRHFALLTAGVSSGQLVGPLLGGALLQSGTRLLPSTSEALFVAAAIAALATVVAAFAERDRSVEPGSPGERADQRLLPILRTRGVPSAIFASVAVLSATDIFTAYLPVLGERREIAPVAVGAILALRAGASLVSRIGIARLVRRFGRLRLISVSALAAAAGLSGFTLTGNVAVFALLAIVVGAGLGFAQPLSMTMVVQLVPDRLRASALALRLTGNRLGQVAAPAAAGVIASSAGASGVFWLTSGLLVASGGAISRRRSPGTAAVNEHGSVPDA